MLYSFVNNIVDKNILHLSPTSTHGIFALRLDSA